MRVSYRLSNIPFCKKSVPSWAKKVNRWHQLDGESFCLAQATSLHLDFFEGIERVFLVSTEGSTHTDRLFVTDRKFSPSHFVHTLPNVRSLSFSLISGFEGEVFCLGGDSNSLMRIFSQLERFKESKSTLIVSVNQKNEEFLCDFFKVGGSHLGESVDLESLVENENKPKINDCKFREFLKNKEQVTLETRSVGFRKNV